MKRYVFGFREVPFHLALNSLFLPTAVLLSTSQPLRPNERWVGTAERASERANDRLYIYILLSCYSFPVKEPWPK